MCGGGLRLRYKLILEANVSDYEYNKSLGLSNTDALSLAHAKEATEKRLSINKSPPQNSSGGGGSILGGLLGLFGILLAISAIEMSINPYIWVYNYLLQGVGRESIAFFAIFAIFHIPMMFILLSLVRIFFGFFVSLVLSIILIPIINLLMCYIGYILAESFNFIASVKGAIWNSQIFVNAALADPPDNLGIMDDAAAKEILYNIPDFILSGGIGWFFVGLVYAILWFFLFIFKKTFNAI